MYALHGYYEFFAVIHLCLTILTFPLHVITMLCYATIIMLHCAPYTSMIISAHIIIVYSVAHVYLII